MQSVYYIQLVKWNTYMVLLKCTIYASSSIVIVDYSIEEVVIFISIKLLYSIVKIIKHESDAGNIMECLYACIFINSYGDICNKDNSKNTYYH